MTPAAMSLLAGARQEASARRRAPARARALQRRRLSAPTDPARADDAELADLVVARRGGLWPCRFAGLEVDRLVAYVRLIERWNATYNLTAIRDPSRHGRPAHPRLPRRDRCRSCGVAAPGAASACSMSAAVPGCRGSSSPSRRPDWRSPASTASARRPRSSPRPPAPSGSRTSRRFTARVESAGRPTVRRHRQPRLCVAERASCAGPRTCLREAGDWMAMKGKTPHDELARAAPDLTFHVEPLARAGLAAERCLVWIERR